MKKLLVLLMICCMCTACGAKEEAAEVPEQAVEVVEETEEVTEEAVAEEAEATEGTKIVPLPTTIDMNALDNCTLAVSFEEGDAYVDDTGAMQLDVTVYTYDLYDMVDISALKVGDILGLRFGEKYSEYEILSIAEHAAKQDAADMYRALG